MLTSVNHLVMSENSSSVIQRASVWFSESFQAWLSPVPFLSKWINSIKSEIRFSLSQWIRAWVSESHGSQQRFVSLIQWTSRVKQSFDNGKDLFLFRSKKSLESVIPFSHDWDSLLSVCVSITTKIHSSSVQWINWVSESFKSRLRLNHFWHTKHWIFLVTTEVQS